MVSLLILYIIAGLFLVAIALPLALQKVGPNSYYGFRVPKTLSDTRIWYLANSYAGFRLMAAGLVIAIGAPILYCIPGLTIESYAWSVLSLVILSFTTAIFFSFRYLSRLS